MARPEFRFNCFLVLVLCSTVNESIFIQPQTTNLKQELQKSSQETVPLYSQNSTSPNRSANSSKLINESNAPPVFPQEGTNGTKIITSNTTLKDASSLPRNNNQVQTTSTNSAVNINVTETKTNTMKVSSNNTNTITTVNPVNKNTAATKTTSTPQEVTSEVNITNKASNSSKIDTEVPDLNSPINGLEPKPIPDSPPNITFNSSQEIDTETETIEDGHNTEEVLRNVSHADSFSTPGVPVVQGQLAAILAGVFVIIAVVAYVVMMSWRRYLEKRYGNRQMLVNEDEFTDDLRHFSI